LISREKENMENSSDIVAPPVLTGWMRKQGRKGLIKNWKRRYFVLKYGKLTYYENEAKQFPLGDGLKVSNYSLVIFGCR
jgi:hypothetical protein